jgi:hypothetical protein
MEFIPSGALVAGTPVNSLPRVADEEMAGLQLVLGGFYIDVFAYPNEEGAIPLTNVSREEARTLCEQRDKRLCSELEWERACKGPDNKLYEYGDRYRPEVCGTGSRPLLSPSGLRVGCKSDFGVHDLHGGVWEWTDSPWGRGSDDDRAAIRGGNDMAGRLVGRCANARPQAPNRKSGAIGFRCCAGERNSSEVVLDVSGRRGLFPREPYDKKLVERVFAVLPSEALEELGSRRKLNPWKMWYWNPIANEELVVVSGCSTGADPHICGAVVARASFDAVNVLAWASAAHWPVSLHPERNPRDLWLLGGDDVGRFKRRIAYAWGEVRVGEIERRVGPLKPPAKKGKAAKKSPKIKK